MTKPRRHKSVGNVRNCCNHSQSRCMPTLRKKKIKRGWTGCRITRGWSFSLPQSDSAIVHNGPKENKTVSAHVTMLRPLVQTSTPLPTIVRMSASILNLTLLPIPNRSKLLILILLVKQEWSQEAKHKTLYTACNHFSLASFGWHSWIDSKCNTPVM